jgi:hypothetical protein
MRSYFGFKKGCLIDHRSIATTIMGITGKQLRQERYRMTCADTRFAKISYDMLKQANKDALRQADEDARKEEILSRVRAMDQQTSDMMKKHKGPTQTTTCVLCCDLPPRVVLRPCNHAQFCKQCVLRILREDNPVCPICRRALDAIQPFLEPYYK